MSSGFVTESEVAEARQRRQEEWERVRTADEPMEAPEQPYDGRSLFDRLQEQKNKKDLDFEESRKMKNMIRGLDDDEVEYLSYVDQRKLTEERKKIEEEQQELKDFREKVATLQEQNIDTKLQQELAPQSRKAPSSTRLSQKSILSGGIKRKSLQTTEPVSKRPTPQTPAAVETPEDNTKSALKCVAVLPGLGTYDSNSDSDLSSDNSSCGQPSDVDLEYDFVGRKYFNKNKCEED